MKEPTPSVSRLYGGQTRFVLPYLVVRALMAEFRVNNCWIYVGVKSFHRRTVLFLRLFFVI